MSILEVVMPHNLAKFIQYKIIHVRKLWHDYGTLKYKTHCKKLTCTCMHLGWKSSLFILMHGWDFIKNQEFVKNNTIKLGANWTPPT